MREKSETKKIGQKNNTFVSGNTGDEKNLQPGGYKN